MRAAATDRLPLGALLALAMAGFITILTEALPAGLLVVGGWRVALRAAHRQRAQHRWGRRQFAGWHD